ncbi:endothelin-converting enzyme homolog isoform X2 [Acropora millepora]|uniref:endothelin-converting enzyme homolog isoform X2 n=1 Tax=Acropora millepora TaxID=45264 RepID=UPI001CF29BB0|nr:endothelin-converting enzyme homolog isoform X2 [Acropora millepora]
MMDSTSQAKGVGDISTEEGRRQQVSPVEMEGKDKGKESSIVVKSLLVIIAMVVVCCVVLLHLYLTERAKRPNTITEKLMENSTRRTSKRRSYFGGLCWSKECLHAASDLLNSIDPSIDPCEDFYQYACGGWMRKNPRPVTSSRWDQFEKTNAENNQLIEMLLKDREVKAIYSKLTEPFPLTLLSRRQHLTNDTRNARIRQAYKDLMRNLTAKLATNQSSESNLTEAFEFDRELAKLGTPPFKRKAFDKAYNKLTVKELQIHTGNFLNWTEYLEIMMEENSFQVRDQTEVVVFSLEYLQKLIQLLESTPKRTLVDYIMWKVVNQKYIYLSSEYIELFKFFYLQAYNHWRDSDQRQLCLLTTTLKFGIPLAKVFLDQKFFGDSKKSAMGIVSDIRAAFIATLDQQDWMDNTTRMAAKQKAERLIENVGYPDYIMDVDIMTSRYKEVQIHPKTYFDNDVSIDKNKNQMKLARAGTKIDKSEWPFPPTMLNAFYSYNENKMVFPAAILQPPFYNVLYPSAMNYGAIGGVMAHEITHGFDDKGKLYDSEGNRRKWWSNSTLSNFHRNSRCLEDQYSNFTFYGYKVDGQKTLSENIADNGAVRVALKAYQKWVSDHWEEPRLPGMMLTNEQVFFLSFARNWCSHYSPRAAGFAAKYYEHSPMPWRVNGTLRNFSEFSKAFKCPKGSPMNPERKCRVW